MRFPTSPTPHHDNVRPATPSKPSAKFERDDELELGWECANPFLQIDSWREEMAAEVPQSAH
jgi:hypothetical protein